MYRLGEPAWYQARPHVIGAAVATGLFWLSNAAGVVSDRLFQIADHEKRLVRLERRLEDVEVQTRTTHRHQPEAADE